MLLTLNHHSQCIPYSKIPKFDWLKIHPRRYEYKYSTMRTVIRPIIIRINKNKCPQENVKCDCVVAVVNVVVAVVLPCCYYGFTSEE